MGSTRPLAMSSTAASFTTLPQPEGSRANESQRIGEALVESGGLTPEQLVKLLRVQSRLEDHKPIGQLAIELGMITRARLEESLRQPRRRLSLEGIFVERGVVRAEQVAAAREALKGSTKDLAKHLVEMGVVAERVYVQAYCESTMSASSTWNQAWSTGRCSKRSAQVSRPPACRAAVAEGRSTQRRHRGD